MPVSSAQLIDAAIERGLIDADTVAQLRIQARRDRSDLLDLITTHYRFPLSTLYRALAESRGLPFVDPTMLTPPEELVRRIPRTLLQRRHLLPIEENGTGVTVATSNPDDHTALEAIERLLGQSVRLAVADPDALELAITKALSHTGRHGLEPAESMTTAPTDAVTLLDQIFKEAFLRRASDIHVEPQEEGVRVRLRVDGRLQIYLPALSELEGAGLLSRIKVLAGLDIAEQRAPQDGGFTYHPPFGNTAIDVRVATAPTRWGERATLRLLGLEAASLTLEAIGMSSRELARFRDVIRRPHGIILLTGPTGSGKTTTLYAALREINSPEVNILTVEDPIEYVIPGISQVEVGEKISFAKALRSFLRHDPDVLLVGEIRDLETVDVALKAAMTGHLVFSTLHTHSACSAVTRLVDIGCERYLLASTLAAVIAQRLVRRLCPRCAAPYQPAPEELAMLKIDDPALFSLRRPAGCAYCLGTGYRGRIGVFEGLWITPELSQLITKGATESELRAGAGDELLTLWTDGRDKVLSGITTLEEVLKVTMPDS
ncbi:MAG: type II/IV secretion system protein [Nitrospirae bacterium]|nr:MAG: type II/IV secretion system protein [Nitrospirota bacterium]